MTKIIFIHFAPLEWYPPIQNLLSELEGKSSNKIIVLTTAQAKSSLTPFQPTDTKIKIIRLGAANRHASPVVRYWNYFYFYTASFLLLFIKRPNRILYFETLSSFPVYLYHKFIKKTTRIFIHYHEYTTPIEYRNGMRLSAYFHQLEKKMYPKAHWISHTNEHRMEQFKKDIYPVRFKNSYILPNYPPRNWTFVSRAPVNIHPIKIVYAGAVSLDTMYVREFAQWIVGKSGDFIWDIYTYNITDAARTYLLNLDSPFISLKPGVDYGKLAQLLRQYDVGVILYNGHIPNYVWNAPNKLFEYLACGLDVWFPTIMKGSLPYVKDKSYPKVLAVDFTKLGEFDFEKATKRTGLDFEKTEYFSQQSLKEIINQLLIDDRQNTTIPSFF